MFFYCLFLVLFGHVVEVSFMLMNNIDESLNTYFVLGICQTANAIPVLCVARNVICNVRGSFFK